MASPSAMSAAKDLGMDSPLGTIKIHAGRQEKVMRRSGTRPPVRRNEGRPCGSLSPPRDFWSLLETGGTSSKNVRTPAGGSKSISTPFFEVCSPRLQPECLHGVRGPHVQREFAAFPGFGNSRGRRSTWATMSFQATDMAAIERK